MATALAEVAVGAAALRGRLRRNTVWVIGVALVARAAVVCYALRHFAPGWFFTRGLEMGLLGQSLLRGRGLSSPVGGETGPTAMIAPAYPVLVAGVFRVFGVSTQGSAAVLMGLHVLVNLVTVWLIVRVARRVAGERAAVMAGLVWGCSLPVVWMPTIFWETNFSAALLLGFLAIALELEGRPGRWRWLGSGAYVGVAGLVNPALLPCLGGMAAWAAWRRARRLVLVGVGFVVVFAAWPVRNAFVFHAFIPTRTTVGFELWMGNRPGATGYLDESLFPMFNQGELADYRKRGEVGYMAHKSEVARAYMWGHPGRTMGLTAVRLGRFWSGSGTRGGSLFFVLYALTTTVLGGLGLVRLMRGKRLRTALLFAIPLVLFPLPYTLTHAEFRYRLVIDPVMCVLAAGVMSRRDAVTRSTTCDGWRAEHKRPLT